MTNLVCFSGQMASGKTEAATCLTYYLNKNFTSKLENKWKSAAFGDAVKEVYQQAFNVDRKFIEDWKRNPEPPPGFLKNVRESLMWIGDGLRQINGSCWINILFKTYADTNLVIGDGRYVSELESVRARQGVNVLMWRPDMENDNPHPSESQLKEYIDHYKKTEIDGRIDDVKVPFDYFIRNDGTLSDLFHKIEKLSYEIMS